MPAGGSVNLCTVEGNTSVVDTKGLNQLQRLSRTEALLPTSALLHEGCVILSHWSATRGPLHSSGSPFNSVWPSI